MNADNPYDSPKSNADASKPMRGVSRKIGTAILVLGLLILTYGAVGFWLINTLPPNGGAYGRLPSLYVTGVGIVVSVVGLAARGLRFGREDNRSSEGSRKGIPTIYGILGLVAILIILVFVISRL